MSYVEEKERFNSVSHVEKKGSILWDILFEKNVNHVQKGFHYLTHFPKVNSLSQEKKGSTLQVIWKNLNSFSHIAKVLLREVQFFDSYFEKGSILWVVLKKGSFLWGRLQKESSILWAFFCF